MNRIITKLLMLVLVALTVKASAQTVIQGEITSNTTFYNTQIYLLKGYVYVTTGVTLTIEKGTIIKGDKGTKGTLIIEQGAKIMANGTAAYPIVFTSNQPKGVRNYGDWGGLIICGKARTNWTAAKDGSGNTLAAGMAQVEGGPRSLYGGADDADNSGVLQYVRLEFGGIAFSPNNETNGLTLCAVGSGTTVDHIQVTYCGDDSYEFFGGTVNAKYLIAHRGWDDDFDMDCGYSGKLQFLMGLRDCYAADQSGSKAFEIDAYQTGTNTVMPTKPVISNATLIGGNVNIASVCDPQFTSAAHIRKGAQPKFYNTVFASFPAGVLISNEGTPDSYKGLGIRLDSVITFKNCVFAGFPTSGFDKTFVYATNNVRNLTPISPQGDTVTGSPFMNGGPYLWLNSNTSTASANRLLINNAILSTTQIGLKLTNPFTMDNPSFLPLASSKLVYNASLNKSLADDATITPDFGASFTDALVADPFFTKVSYSGAFGLSATANDNWASGWTNFDPNSTDYSTPLQGIRNSENTINANIYPNPANDEFNVRVDINAVSDVKISLIDLTGKLVISSVTKEVSGLNTITINTSTLASGIYFVEVETNEGIATQKINIK
jgi:hypothetical protein